MKKFSLTTKANSRHTSRDKNIRTIVIVGVICIALLVVVPRAIAFIANLVLAPVHSFQSWLTVSTDSFPMFFRDRSELIKEINTFKSTQSSQSGDKLTIDLLTHENSELRSLLGSEGSKRILAGVIGRPNKLPYDVIVLDKGSLDGVVEGAPVYISGNTVIGIVAKDFPKSSVVELITTPGFTASVYIIGPNIYTNAVGVGGGQLRVSVPQGIVLKEGDLVVLPGSDSGIYGAIHTIQTTATQPEQYGFVSPDVPMESLRLVSVGDRALEPVSFAQAQAIVAETKTTMLQVPVPEHMLVTAEGTSTASSSKAASSTKAHATTTP